MPLRLTIQVKRQLGVGGLRPIYRLKPTAAVAAIVPEAPAAAPVVAPAAPAAPAGILSWIQKAAPAPAAAAPAEMSYTDFLRALRRREFRSVRIRQDLSALVAASSTDTERTWRVYLPEAAPGLLEEFQKYDVEVAFQPVAGSGGAEAGAARVATDLLQGFAIYVAFAGLFWMFIQRGMGRGANPFSKIGGGELSISDSTGITFADVAGADNAKRDLQELVDFLKTPEKYATLGAKMPKGVLLYGAPGCGKTLLARAVAGEAGVPFLYCSGSDFLEMFVGVGASRVRDLFQKARDKAPCIIFIDEIDAVGRARGGNVPGAPANDERDQTINQMLTNLDGFEPNAGVVVIAATNRPDILDPALLRPGRFDRRVEVELPDAIGRAAILRIHAAGKPIHDAEVELQRLSKITVGFSGADLQNVVNEAAILAARENATAITGTHLNNALERMVLGETRRTLMITDAKKRILATHEAGHAVMGLVMRDYDRVRKISIVPRGRTGGATYFEPTEDRLDLALLSREYLESKIMVALGGRVAEELIFGTMQITTGASGDLQQVFYTAYQMVATFGFNETLGKLAWSEAGDMGITREIQAEMRFLVDRLYAKTRETLEENEGLLRAITAALIEKETLSDEDILELMRGSTCDRGVEEGV